MEQWPHHDLSYFFFNFLINLLCHCVSGDLASLQRAPRALSSQGHSRSSGKTSFSSHILLGMKPLPEAPQPGSPPLLLGSIALQIQTSPDKGSGAMMICLGQPLLSLGLGKGPFSLMHMGHPRKTLRSVRKGWGESE